VVVAPRAGIPRRRALVGLLLIPPALSGCALGGATARRPPDPLIALADAARADAVLATAAITADLTLAERVQPLVDARTAHAAALDAEVQRRRPNRAPIPAAPVPAVTGVVSLARVRAAVQASADAAAVVALDLSVDRVGLVASVAACCTAYAAALT
jgi:hypothetical protein